MQIKNEMEVFVEERLDSVLKQYPDFCTCEKCRGDVKALALNHLPPKYVCSQMGGVYAKAENFCQKNEAAIIQEIAKAVSIVAARPRHE